MRFIRDVSGIDDSPIVNRGCDDSSMISTRNCCLARMAPIWVPDMPEPRMITSKWLLSRPFAGLI